MALYSSPESCYTNSTINGDAVLKVKVIMTMTFAVSVVYW